MWGGSSSRPNTACLQFFYRKLKPSARPIAVAGAPDVAVSAADCRLSAFVTVTDATRCWIKVPCLHPRHPALGHRDCRGMHT